METQRAFIIKIEVFDFKKRYNPEKHYVYCIKINWSNESKQFVYRRYSQFHDLKLKLEEMFQSESGSWPGRPEDRIIPLLPGRVLFRSQVKAIALERIKLINDYCIKLVSLRNEISKSDLVLDFFKLTADDSVMHTDESVWLKTVKETKPINPLEIGPPIKPKEYLVERSYRAKTKSELSVKKGTKVFVIEKSLTGWWFVDSKEGQGYIPQCVLQKIGDFESKILEEAELYLVIQNYAAQKTDELSLEKNDFVEVLKKCQSGFWKVRLFSKKEGLVPAVCLRKVLQGPNCPIMTLANSFKVKVKNECLEEIKHPEFDPASLIDNENVLNSSTDSFNNSLPASNNKLIFTKAAPTQPVPTCGGECKVEDIFYSIDKYVDQVGDGISFGQGEKFNVLKRDKSNGWWYIQNANNHTVEGWAPSTFLAVKPKPETKLNSPERKSVKTLSDKEADRLLLEGVSSVSDDYIKPDTMSFSEHILKGKSSPKNLSQTESTPHVTPTPLQAGISSIRPSDSKKNISQKKVAWEESNQNDKQIVYSTLVRENINPAVASPKPAFGSTKPVLKTNPDLISHDSAKTEELDKPKVVLRSNNDQNPSKETKKNSELTNTKESSSEDHEIEHSSETLKFNDELKKLTNILRQKPNEQPRNLPTLTVESTHETGMAKLKKLKNANKQN